MLDVCGAYMTIRNFLYTYEQGNVSTEKEGLQLEEDRKIIIPDYQREYRWGEKQIIELFNDITNGNCYLGQIAVARNKLEPKNYYLVDGQQRITSIIILLTVLTRYFYLYDDSVNIKEFELHKPENNKYNSYTTSRLQFETNCFENFQTFLCEI